MLNDRICFVKDCQDIGEPRYLYSGPWTGAGSQLKVTVDLVGFFCAEHWELISRNLDDG